ncbi:hypothetical protein [Paenibacillus sp. SI8]
MYWLERMESNRWLRWQVRLIAVGLVANSIYHGLKWLYHVVF